MTVAPELRNQLVEIGRRLATRGFVAGSDGNLSARLPDGNILITPSGAAKGELAPDDLVVIDPDGRPIDGPGKPSSEAAMHLHVYRRRPDIMACVHAHPPTVTAFAATGTALPDNILPEVILFVGKIPMTAYAPPGTDAVPQSLEPFIGEHNAFVLRNHGLLTIGRTVREAWHRHETVEHYARIVALARQLGSPESIPADDIRRLEEMRRQMSTAPPEPS